MSEKHYPYIGGSFDRIVFDGDGSVWVPESENAKLRAERDYLLMNANPTATELRRVRRAWKKDRDENAELRKLVPCLLTCASYDCDCDKCPINGGAGIWQPEAFCSELIDRMRELGIEVEP